MQPKKLGFFRYWFAAMKASWRSVKKWPEIRKVLAGLILGVVTPSMLAGHWKFAGIGKTVASGLAGAIVVWLLDFLYHLASYPVDQFNDANAAKETAVAAANREKALLEQQLADTRSRAEEAACEFAATQAEKPRLVFEETLQVKTHHPRIRVRVRNTSERHTADDVKVQVLRARPTEFFSEDEFPVLLHTKSESDHGTKSIHQGDSEFFDVVQYGDWDVSLRSVENFGSFKIKDMPPEGFELDLRVSGRNATPDEATFKLSWNPSAKRIELQKANR